MNKMVDHMSSQGKSQFHSRLITAKEAANYLGIRPKTFWEWVNKGIIPQVKIPGVNPKYDIHDIDLLIENNKCFAESVDVVQKLTSKLNNTNQ